MAGINPTAHRTPVGLALAAGSLLVITASLPGCGSGGVSAGDQSALRPADFRGAAPPPTTTTTANAAATTAAPSTAVVGATPVAPSPPAGVTRVVSPAEASGGVGEVAVIAGAEPTAQIRPDAKPAEQFIMVDSLVGQINGKPVFASKFLAPLDGRLRELARQTDNNRLWQREAIKLILNELQTQVRDELFLAEARAALSPEQRQGLFFFVQQLREQLVSGYGGSQEQANEALQEQEGRTLEEKVQDERDKALVRALVTRYVTPLVNVSWRDVKREYDRDNPTYNPPPTAKIRIIMVAAADQASVDKVAGELAAGNPFADVAKQDANRFARGEGGLIGRRVEGEYATAKIFEDTTLNTQAQKLTPGATTGPFDLTTGGTKVKAWMHLEGFDQPPGQSLEQVQLAIYQKLRAQKFDEETKRFFQRLMDRGSRTPEKDMAERLLAIASERYLILLRPAKP
jgi:hypothetical protein